VKDLKKYTILVVDDEDALREAMVFDFQRKGFTVVSAENGVKALELVKKNKIDLVVSDMRMPGGDGMTLLENIRAYDPKLPTLIFVTGYSDFSEEECITKGAKTVLSKPFERKTLMKVVFETLGIEIGKKAA
jgi:CheY-like chemotaxis protein